MTWTDKEQIEYQAYYDQRTKAEQDILDELPKDIRENLLIYTKGKLLERHLTYSLLYYRTFIEYREAGLIRYSINGDGRVYDPEGFEEKRQTLLDRYRKMEPFIHPVGDPLRATKITIPSPTEIKKQFEDLLTYNEAPYDAKLILEIVLGSKRVSRRSMEEKREQERLFEEARAFEEELKQYE